MTSLAGVSPAVLPALPFCCRCQSHHGSTGMTMFSPVLGKGSEILPREVFILLPWCAELDRITTVLPTLESQRPAFQKAAGLAGEKGLGLLKGKETERYPPLQEIHLTCFTSTVT